MGMEYFQKFYDDLLPLYEGEQDFLKDEIAFKNDNQKQVISGFADYLFKKLSQKKIAFPRYCNGLKFMFDEKERLQFVEDVLLKKEKFINDLQKLEFDVCDDEKIDLIQVIARKSTITVMCGKLRNGILKLRDSEEFSKSRSVVSLLLSPIEITNSLKRYLLKENSKKMIKFFKPFGLSNTELQGEFVEMINDPVFSKGRGRPNQYAPASYFLHEVHLILQKNYMIGEEDKRYWPLFIEIVKIAKNSYPPYFDCLKNDDLNKDFLWKIIRNFRGKMDQFGGR